MDATPRHRLVYALLCLALLCLAPLSAAPRATASTQAAGDILVTAPGYDDIGQVLSTRLGLAEGTHWTQIDANSVSNYDAIKSAKTLFINCTFNSPDHGAQAGVADSLRRYVEGGGTLYTSDWAYSYIQAAFPGYLQFYGADPLAGETGVIQATVEDSGLRNYLFGSSATNTIDLNYDLPGWAVIDRVLNGNVRVLLTGDVQTYDANGNLVTLPRRPLAVTFPYGQGRVIYTTFHNEQQQSELEKRLLEYIVLIPMTTGAQQQVAQAITERGLFVARQDLNLVDQGTSVEGFYQPRAGAELVVALSWTRPSGKTAADTFRLSVYRPDGQPYLQQDSSTAPLLISVPASAVTGGSWRYVVTAVSTSSSNYPIAVGIGVTPSKVYLPSSVR